MQELRKLQVIIWDRLVGSAYFLGLLRAVGFILPCTFESMYQGNSVDHARLRDNDAGSRCLFLMELKSSIENEM